MKAFKKKDLYILKAAINGFSGESRRIRAKEIHPKSLDEKAQGWHRKRELGWHSRYHQLAYALMLGKRYDEVEKNRPLYFNDWETKAAINEIINIVKMYGDYRVRYDRGALNPEAIAHWFKTGENTVFNWEPRVKTFKVKVVNVIDKTKRLVS